MDGKSVVVVVAAVVVIAVINFLFLDPFAKNNKIEFH